MHFDGHAEFGNPPFCLLEGPLQESEFCGLKAKFPFTNESNNFLAQYFLVANGFKFAEPLVHLRVSKVLRNSSSSIYWDGNDSSTLIFVGFNGHDVVVALELTDGAPLPRREVSEASFLLERETATPVFVLEFGDAFFDASVGERGCPFGFQIKARYVADTWLLPGRIKIKEGHTTEVTSKLFQAFVDVVRRSWASRAVFHAHPHEGASPWGDDSFFTEIMKGRVVGIAIELGGSHLADVIFNIFPHR